MTPAVRAAIRSMDRALKRLYNLEPGYRAENFLVSRPVNVKAAGNADFKGALYVRTNPWAESVADLSLAIYLSEPVVEELASFRSWRTSLWSRAQIAAFTVAAEEISHFHYLLYHASRTRQVSQLELELQGDIDKFLLTYFANFWKVESSEEAFDALFEQLFYRFRLSEISAPRNERVTSRRIISRGSSSESVR